MEKGRERGREGGEGVPALHAHEQGWGAVGELGGSRSMKGRNSPARWK